MERGINGLRQYLRGWMQYFRLAKTPSVYRELDGWPLRRLRQCRWKQWKLARTRLRELRALKLREWHARELAFSRKAYWRLSGGPLSSVMPVDIGSHGASQD
jgi:RNA-directed DNA polymerase